MATSGVIAETNQKLIGMFTGLNAMKIIGWIVFILMAVGGFLYVYLIYRNRKLFKKKITIFEIVGINFVPAMRDAAKVVKIGSGGFEILYLKKLKIYRIAYGGKVGKDTYYFFILSDGYWYNGMLSADMFQIDKKGGLIPVVTTNPTMRSQYTSLEKQIDSLHAAKTSFMDKYGSWILSIGFVLVAGVMLFLCYKEYAVAMGSLSGLVDKITNSWTSVCGCPGGGTPAVPSGLVPVG